MKYFFIGNSIDFENFITVLLAIHPSTAAPLASPHPPHSPHPPDDMATPTTLHPTNDMSTPVEDLPTIAVTDPSSVDFDMDNWQLPEPCDPTIDPSSVDFDMENWPLAEPCGPTFAHVILDKDKDRIDNVDDDTVLHQLPEPAHGDNTSCLPPKWACPYIFACGVCLLSYSAADFALRLRNR